MTFGIITSILSRYETSIRDNSKRIFVRGSGITLLTKQEKRKRREGNPKVI